MWLYIKRGSIAIIAVVLLAVVVSLMPSHNYTGATGNGGSPTPMWETVTPEPTATATPQPGVELGEFGDRVVELPGTGSGPGR